MQQNARKQAWHTEQQQNCFMHIQASTSDINVSHIHGMKIFPAATPAAGCSR